MGKLILIYADGTGQIGGLRPDQRLSNVYKLYRATRPGPDSPIQPSEQVAFYDAGLGAGEVNGLTFRRIRNTLSSAVGTGIDQNVVDCYAAIISNYQPEDAIALIGFSRGAYTVRSLANVMNLCGVPTTNGAGGPVPRYGPALRKIANDAVRYVYNHGAGSRRDQYEEEREKKAARFRTKYGSAGAGADGEAQGNVQPTFIGVFDTVAALGSRSASLLALIGFAAVTALAWWVTTFAYWWLSLVFWAVPVAVAYWVIQSLAGQIKFFVPDEYLQYRWWDPRRVFVIARHTHLAWWSGKHYDRYVDREVPFLRHALAIDESRSKFPRVPWGRRVDVEWNNERGHTGWLKQVWFAGNHSDIGGSYLEEESRLSDIALAWMVDEIRKAIPSVRIRDELLAVFPDHRALQHDERQYLLDLQPRWLRWLTRSRLTWRKELRKIEDYMTLHESVPNRLRAGPVPQMDAVADYRPPNLSSHPQAREFFAAADTGDKK
ncbi:hypothetical protein IZ6_28940 [Terrihabitans soli]|uniref:T6SS Phospholipase effector Tle1-like catalytic domain-containing protein n=1 Tax=Terrihabitans soli TaxID=708113 RepID=A0A6S6QST7_9HYPH|nr:DUF2235 domain-containing protein [Terrihabitans soli]BCJ92159.1 hypothetical protein IZ6_28940 [Terrihabitans soli]